MPSILKCSCGKEFPIYRAPKKCPVCNNTLIKHAKYYCKICGKYTKECNCKPPPVDDYKRKVIKSNMTPGEYLNQYKYDLFAEYEQMYFSNGPYDKITEETWVEIYMAYNGCVVCHSDDVFRHLLIPIEKGGKYDDCNVIPLCPDCLVGFDNLFNFYTIGSFKSLLFIIKKQKERIKKYDKN